jgi:hypothetical protein
MTSKKGTRIIRQKCLFYKNGVIKDNTNPFKRLCSRNPYALREKL